MCHLQIYNLHICVTTPQDASCCGVILKEIERLTEQGGWIFFSPAVCLTTSELALAFLYSYELTPLGRRPSSRITSRKQLSRLLAGYLAGWLASNALEHVLWNFSGKTTAS